MKLLNGLDQDVRFGFRQLLRKPGVPILIILLLALGIGVNAAIFSVVKAVVLEPLPFEDPDRLVQFWETNPEFNRQPLSAPTFLDFRDKAQSFEQLVCYRPYPINLTGDGEPERILRTQTTTGLFEMLRVQPALGRTFAREEEEAGHDKVVIMSDGLWKRRYGADPSILGKTITMDDEVYTVVGVMPPGFQHPSPWRTGQTTELWSPFVLRDHRVGRSSHWLLAMGRIRHGISMEAAQEEMTAIAAGLEEQYPDDMEGQGARLVLAREELVGRYTGQLLMLLGAAGLVLMIVCGNVAGLLIAKSTTRQTEVAVRASLGASRTRLVRQLLTENVSLFLVGGGLAVVLSIWGVQVLRATIPSNIPRVDGIGLDSWVLVFTLGISILTGVLFGLVPAFSVSRTDLSEPLKQGRARWGTGRSRTRNALVVVQFALTLVLANGAALMLESYWSLRNQDQGFRTEGVLLVMLNPQGPRYEGEGKVFAFYQQALERIKAIPSVTHAAATSKLPLNGGTNSWMKVEGKDYGDERGPLVEMSMVSYDYIDTMGIPLIMGRNLTPQDSAAGQPGVLINQTAAKQMWPDEDPLGKRFQNNPDFWFTVVGVVQDVRQWGIERDPIPETYMPHIHGQENSFVWVRYVAVRTEVDPMSLVGPVKEAIWSVDPSLPVSGAATTGQLVSRSLSRRTFNTILIGVFAALGLVLVAAGTYGVMSYFVSQRTHEIGLRMALGSNRSGVLQLVFKQGLKLAAVGVAIGVVGTFAAQKLTASMIYGVSPVEPWTLVGGTLFLVTVGVVGTLVPARRASRIDPVLALREE